MKVSVMILTKDEEDNITDCINCAKLVSDDITVLDSYSTDDTVKNARNLGVTVIQRKFDGWALHQNWAVRNIEFANDWVFYIDADERITHELASEILGLKADNSVNAYKIFRDNRFLNGEKLKYSMACPGIVRLFRPNCVRYERDINPVCIVDGGIQPLKHRLTHYNFSKGLEPWILKHLDYARREAKEMEIKTPNVKYLKRFSYNITRFRFFFRLIYQLFFKLGILDGYAGLRYAVLISFYDHLIEEFARAK